jgi:DNA-binding response OmpR family regulator
MKAKILLAEDDVSIGRMTMFKLKREGFEVTWFQNGQEALNEVKAIEPDLILLDIMMPGLDGYQVYEALKEDPATESIPVIFLTAKGQTDDILKGIALGVDDYIRKPFKPNELVRRVKKTLYV